MTNPASSAPAPTDTKTAGHLSPPQDTKLAASKRTPRTKRTAPHMVALDLLEGADPAGEAGESVIRRRSHWSARPVPSAVGVSAGPEFDTLGRVGGGWFRSA